MSGHQLPLQQRINNRKLYVLTKREILRLNGFGQYRNKTVKELKQILRDLKIEYKLKRGATVKDFNNAFNDKVRRVRD